MDSRRVFEKGWANRAATVRERFSHPKPYRFLTGVARKEASQTRSKRRSLLRPGSLMILLLAPTGCWSTIGSTGRATMTSTAGKPTASASPRSTQSLDRTQGTRLTVGNETIETAPIWRHVSENVLARSTSWSDDEFRSYVEREAVGWITNEIAEALMYQRASLRLDPKIEANLDNIIDTEIRKIVAAKHGGIQHRYEKHLELHGDTLTKVRTRLRREILIARLLEMEVKPKVAEPTRDELLALYEANKDAWQKPHRRSMSLIDLRVIDQLPEGVTEPTRRQLDAAREATRTKIEAARQEILSGVDFADVARRHSSGLHAVDGGRWGWVTRGSVRKRFEPVVEALYTLQPGQVSDLVATPDCFFLVRCDAHDPGENPDFQAVQPRLKQHHFGNEYNRLVAKLIAELRSNVRIEPIELERIHAAVVELAMNARRHPSAANVP